MCKNLQYTIQRVELIMILRYASNVICVPVWVCSGLRVFALEVCVSMYICGCGCGCGCIVIE